MFLSPCSLFHNCPVHHHFSTHDPCTLTFPHMSRARSLFHNCPVHAHFSTTVPCTLTVSTPVHVHDHFSTPVHVHDHFSLPVHVHDHFWGGKTKKKKQKGRTTLSAKTSLAYPADSLVSHISHTSCRAFPFGINPPNSNITSNLGPHQEQ